MAEQIQSKAEEEHAAPPATPETETKPSAKAEAATKDGASATTIRANLKKNPHMKQIVFTNVPHAGDIAVVRRHGFSELPRVLDAAQPRTRYTRVPHKKRTVIHWGQRKLFLSEIEFLTRFHDGTPKLVVYAGAAPGTHIAMLAELFPALRFYLVDPAPFNVSSSDRIEVVQAFFTEETVALLQRRQQADGVPILFVSDIRTADPKVLDEDQIEAAVAEDMARQMEWVTALRPRAAMLKFRLPWKAGSTPYLKGDVYLPVWGRETTTETRLVVSEEDGFQAVPFDNKQYEEQMFHFNRHTRVEYYDHGIYEAAADSAAMDHCYDCAAELLILDQYVRRVRGVQEEARLQRAVAELVASISTACSPEGRTLSHRETARERGQWFDAHRFDYDKRTITLVQEAPPKRRRASDESTSATDST